MLLAVPFSTKPTQAEMIHHFNAVIDATDMDIVLYSCPGKDGVETGYEALDALADNPRVIGIKESSGVLQRAIGIIGTGIAHELQSRGRPVVLVDRDAPGKGASFGNKAAIAVTEFMPASRLSVWRQIAGWVLAPKARLTARHRARHRRPSALRD